MSGRCCYVVCDDGPPNPSFWWPENPSLVTADRHRIVDISQPLAGFDLIISIFTCPKKNHDAENKSFPIFHSSRSTSAATSWPNKISEISEAHALGYARARRGLHPKSRGTLMVRRPWTR